MLLTQMWSPTNKIWGLSWPVSIYRNRDLWRHHSSHLHFYFEKTCIHVHFLETPKKKLPDFWRKKNSLFIKQSSKTCLGVWFLSVSTSFLWHNPSFMTIIEVKVCPFYGTLWQKKSWKGQENTLSWGCGIKSLWNWRGNRFSDLEDFDYWTQPGQHLFYFSTSTLLRNLWLGILLVH